MYQDAHDLKRRLSLGTAGQGSTTHQSEIIYQTALAVVAWMQIKATEPYHEIMALALV